MGSQSIASIPARPAPSAHRACSPPAPPSSAYPRKRRSGRTSLRTRRAAMPSAAWWTLRRSRSSRCSWPRKRPARSPASSCRQAGGPGGRYITRTISAQVASLACRPPESAGGELSCRGHSFTHSQGSEYAAWRSGQRLRQQADIGNNQQDQHGTAKFDFAHSAIEGDAWHKTPYRMGGAGRFLFRGDPDGNFLAIDSKTRRGGYDAFIRGLATMHPPFSIRVDGDEYVAIAAGGTHYPVRPNGDAVRAVSFEGGTGSAVDVSAGAEGRWTWRPDRPRCRHDQDRRPQHGMLFSGPHPN